MLHLTQDHAQWSLLIGRILIGLIFVLAGFQKLMGGIGPLADTIGGVAGLPFPALFAVLTIIIELGVGILFVVGLHTRKSALILILFTLIVTFFFHPGWSDPEHMIPMMKNIGLIGGLLAFGAVGAGALSLDTKMRKHRPLAPMCE